MVFNYGAPPPHPTLTSHMISYGKIHNIANSCRSLHTEEVVVKSALSYLLVIMATNSAWIKQ